MKRSLFFVLPVVSLLFSGCKDEPDSLTLHDQLVVSTSYDATAVFNTFTTYAIPTDTIGFYSNATRDTLLVQGSSSQNFPPRPLLEQIRKSVV